MAMYVVKKKGSRTSASKEMGKQIRACMLLLKDQVDTIMMRDRVSFSCLRRKPEFEKKSEGANCL